MRTLATRVHPGQGRWLHRAEVGQLQPGQQVLLDEADPVLDPPLLLAGSYVARRDLEAPMPGEVQVLCIEHGCLADQALQHGGLQVIDDQARRHAAYGGKCVLVAG
jgi:hypothetical protein